MIWKCYRFLKANSKPVSDYPEHTVQNCTLKPFCIKQIFVALKFSVETGFSIGPVFSHGYNQYMHACRHSYRYAYIPKFKNKKLFTFNSDLLCLFGQNNFINSFSKMTLNYIFKITYLVMLCYVIIISGGL